MELKNGRSVLNLLEEGVENSVGKDGLIFLILKSKKVTGMTMNKRKFLSY